MALTIPLWITESSLVEWEDTTKLDVHFNAGRLPLLLAEGLGEGFADRYEGLVDPAAAVGGLMLPPGREGLDVVPEWAVLFEAPLATLPPIGPATPCVLQGAAEGRWLEELAKPGSVRWSEAALGNNLVARGKGIATTLGAISRGEREVAGARVFMHFPAVNGEMHLRSLSGSELVGIPVLELAAAVQQLAREGHEGAAAVQGMTFGCAGEIHAYAAEAVLGHRLPQTANLPRLLRKLLASDPALTARLLEEARCEAHRDALERGVHLRPGSPIVLTVAGADDVAVGEAAMSFSAEEE